MHVLFITPDLGHNSLGRTYALWLLAAELGWDARVFAARGDVVWSPLAGTSFARACYSGDAADARLRAFADEADVIVGVKPFSTSLGLALRIGRATGTPVLADVDDPDLEAVLSWRNPIRRVGKEFLRRDVVRDARTMRRALEGLAVSTSNPVLQQRYGGVVLPHARPVPLPGTPVRDRRTDVVFVGTNRAHKGVGTLRSAIARLDHDKYHLTITDVRPPDAKPWETWLGSVRMDEGLRLVGGASIVAIPSRRTAYSAGQLPVKLVDAMMAGRTIVASDLAPIRWALGDSGVLVEPGSTSALTRGIERAADEAGTGMMGKAARERAIRMFTVESLAPVFADACARASVPQR